MKQIKTHAKPPILKAAEQHLDRISAACIKRKLTVSVAESATSGFVQLLLSNAKNAQSFFQGGITAYNGAQKTKHLQIEPIYAFDCNCVSQKITVEMAVNVCALFCSEIGVAVTGYATPIPEENINDIYAYIAIVNRSKILYKSRIIPAQAGIKGWTAQEDYALRIVKHLATHLDR